MADQMTNFGRKLHATGNGEPSGKLDWVDDPVSVVLIDTSRYTFDVTHKYLSSIPENARVAIVPLVGKYVTESGACGADNVSIPGLVGSNVGALGLVKMVPGDPLNCPFFLWIDSYTGIPGLPTGGAFEIHWPTDSNRIYRI